MLSSLTISEAHKKMKAKEISAEELMRSCLERIDAVDTKINAVIWHDAERALQEAKKIDQKKSFDDPLAGIPFLTKDVYCEVGIPTTACSNILRNKNYVPPFESTTTKRLKARGALSIGKVNTDEFTMGGSTETSCYGVTKNPWDQTRVAGGVLGRVCSSRECG
jgi:aspartyl-tRNA(Asn)/glutamyl-tRNA(Gln) amidotransferase subunit A